MRYTPEKEVARIHAEIERCGGYLQLARIPDFVALLKEFGPPRQSYHPEYPFWHLQNDGVWVLHGDEDLRMRKGKNQPPKSELLDHNITGEFSQVTFYCREPLSESIHPDILEAVGFDYRTIVRKGQKRDPKFASGC